MKKCSKCNEEYADKVNFCKKCGCALDSIVSKTEKSDTKKSNDMPKNLKLKDNKEEVSDIKVFNIIMYIVGIIVVIGSITDVVNLNFYGILGILFGLSLLPIVQEKVFSIKNIKNNKLVKEHKETIQISIPIILFILWAICSPSGQLRCITINDNEHVIAISEIYEMDFDTNLTETNKENFEYVSSNPEIATVDNGFITGKSEGTVTITATSVNGVSTTSTAEVFEIQPTSVSLNKKSLSLSVGKTAKVTANVSPSNASDKSITWSSSDIFVASVENGVIKAEDIGTAKITATTTNGKKSVIEVTVTKKAPIKIKKFRYKKDYVCGIEWNFSITNNTKKTINYITLKWYNFNGVGDPVYDQINGNNYVQVRYTGPLKPGANSGSKRNMTKFYNCNYKSSAFSDITIEYKDGSTDIISSSDMKYYSNLY